MVGLYSIFALALVLSASYSSDAQGKSTCIFVSCLVSVALFILRHCADLTNRQCKLVDLPITRFFSYQKQVYKKQGGSNQAKIKKHLRSTGRQNSKSKLEKTVSHPTTASSGLLLLL